MSDADTIRSSAPKQPQYPLQNSNARPNISLNQIGVRPPGQQQIQQSNGQQQRPAPPPLRRVDSRGNILVNQSLANQQQRPPGTLPNQQGRPLSGQNPQGRPQPPGNWSGTAGSPTTPTQQQQNRPPFPYGPPGQNQQARPPFQRSPGQHPVTAPNQLPFRPPFPQQQQQQQQQQRSGPPTIKSNQSSPQNSTMSSEVLARSNLSNSFINENDDDDDVVIGNATTPQKYKPADPMTQSQYGTLDSRSTLPPTEDTVKKPSSNYTSFQEEAVKPKSGQSHFGDPEETQKDKTIDKVQNSGFDSEKSNVQKMPPKGSVPVSRKYGEDTVERRPPSGDESKGRGGLDAKSPGKPPKMDYQRRHLKGDNDSGVDESTQGNERNGPESPGSPLKSPTKPSGISRPPSTTPSNKSTKSRSTSRSRALKTPEPEPVKKVPMNKIQVGHAPSPNLKAVKSKIGSLDNAAYKPGGGHVKIESKKIEIKAAPRIEAKNDKYISKGGEKKIVTTKLQWNAKSKIGSLENAHHKPGGGDKKIECLKPDFKDKAKPKVGSKDNVKHTPGGGDIKPEQDNKEEEDIQTHKLEIKAQSKVGSLDNVKHKPGGGNKPIFDDKEYLKNVEHPVALTPPSQSPVPPAMTTSSGADENLNQQQS